MQTSSEQCFKKKKKSALGMNVFGSIAPSEAKTQQASWQKTSQVLRLLTCLSLACYHVVQNCMECTKRRFVALMHKFR